MDSSSSSGNGNDDCMITSFTGGEPFITVDDDAPLLKRFKYDHGEGLSLRTIPGDGHSITNYFAVHFNETSNETAWKHLFWEKIFFCK